jgi:type II secretory pathway pseudopilin PulG
MKQMIILLAMIILGVAISAMVLSFQGTAQSLTDATKTKMQTGLGLGAGEAGQGG